MTDTPAADAATYCIGEVRAHDFGRYASTLFAAPAQRRALLALYAFDGEVSRVRDHVSQPLPGEIRLQWWTDTLSGPAHGGVEGNPVAAELLAAVKAFELPVADLVRLIDGHRFDLYDDPMPSLDALESHVGETDAIVLALAALICGGRGKLPSDLLHHAGIAQGFAGVIAGLPRHAARRQLYLPQQLLELNGARAEDLFAGQVTPALRNVLAHLAREARTHLDLALGAVAELPPELRAAFLPLALTRHALKQLARGDADPFRPVAPSRLSQLWTLWRAARR